METGALLSRRLIPKRVL